MQNVSVKTIETLLGLTQIACLNTIPSRVRNDAPYYKRGFAYLALELPNPLAFAFFLLLGLDDFEWLLVTPLFAWEPSMFEVSTEALLSSSGLSSSFSKLEITNCLPQSLQK